MMKLFLTLSLAGAVGSARMLAAEQPPAEARATVMVVFGAWGENVFHSDFLAQHVSWSNAALAAGAKHVAIGDTPLLQPIEGKEKEDAKPAPAEPTDRDRLREALAAEAKEGAAEFWLVLVGHGTFDGKEAKFNLRGPDVSATELGEWLKPFNRPIALIDTSSSSAPFMAKLAGPKRVVVTSTRSGFEQNYSRFGKYFAEAVGEPKTDLDKDGQVSLLEAYLRASHRTAEFYKTEGRLATEHALLDDNGDGLGTPSDWFRGVRATKAAKDGAPADGLRAHQFHLVRSPAEQQLPAELRAKRDALELEVGKLRDGKAKMPEDRYYRELEKLLVQLAEIYDGT